MATADITTIRTPQATSIINFVARLIFISLLFSCEIGIWN